MCRWPACGPRSSQTRKSRATYAPSGAADTCSRPRARPDLPAAMRLLPASLFARVLLPSDIRDDYRNKLLDEFQLRLLTGDDAPRQLNDYYFPYVARLSQALSGRLDRTVHMRSTVIEGKRWFWVQLSTPQGGVWAGIPRDRI